MVSVSLQELTEPVDSYVMPMESLKGLAMRSPAGLQAIRSIIGTTRSSVVSRRGVDEVLKVINDAKAEWRAIGSKPTVEPSTPVAIDADPVAVEPEIEPPPPPAAAKTDIWDHVGAPAAKSDTSSLFGAALKSAATKSDTSSLFGAALTPAATKSHTSSLFGSVLNPASTPTTKKSSTLLGSILSATNPAPRSSFADVQRAVHADLEPKIAPPVETAPPPAPTPKATLPAPETVPFVPSGSRTTIVMPVQPDPEVMDEEEEGVVPVKRKRGKAKNPVGENPAVVSPGVVALTTSSSSVTYLVNGAPTIVTSSPIPSDGPRREQNIGTRNPSASTSASGKPSLTTPSASSSRDASVPVDNENLPPTKPKRAKKIRAEDVPEFDYSHEPNLLDNPGEYKGRGKKVKTSKKERTKPSEITPLIEKMSKKDKESHGESDILRWSDGSGVYF